MKLKTASVDLPEGVSLRISRLSGARDRGWVQTTISMRSQVGGQDGHCGKADGDLSDDTRHYMNNQGADVRSGESLFGSRPALNHRRSEVLLQDLDALAFDGEQASEGEGSDAGGDNASALVEQCARDLPAADEAVCAAAFEKAHLSPAAAEPFMQGCVIDVCAAQDPRAALGAVTAAAESSSGEGQIRWATKTKWCLEVSGGPLNGTGVQLWPCSGREARNRFLPPVGGRGQIRWAAFPHMCLDVSRGLAKDGNRIQVWRCSSGHPNMEFVMPVGGKGKIRWAADTHMCLDVKHGQAAHGTPIQLWECKQDGHANQELLTGPWLD